MFFFSCDHNSMLHTEPLILITWPPYNDVNETASINASKPEMLRSPQKTSHLILAAEESINFTCGETPVLNMKILLPFTKIHTLSPKLNHANEQFLQRHYRETIRISQGRYQMASFCQPLYVCTWYIQASYLLFRAKSKIKSQSNEWILLHFIRDLF